MNTRLRNPHPLSAATGRHCALVYPRRSTRLCIHRRTRQVTCCATRFARDTSARLTTKMPVPFEAVIPMVLVGTLFGVTGTGFSLVSRLSNDGKPPRYDIDAWDRMMMRRDFRLTGHTRGQAVRMC